MIGNDIIDIHEARRSSNWKRSGFLQKIFTLKEQSIITSSADPFKTVWRLWSMKESAYKIFIQAGGTRFFNPTKIECCLNSLERGQVEIATTTVKTITSIDTNYIFSTAVVGNPTIDTCIFKLPEDNRIKQSRFLHAQLLAHYAKCNSLNLTELQLEKTATGVPVFYYGEKLLTTSISITHHGKYGAYSFYKNEGAFEVMSF